jgi:alkylation response protein AidB-like acyl-CoA dehydrogenase
MGQRGAHTCDVIFDNVKVPAANLIGLQEGKGFKTAMKVLEKGRIHIAAVAVGCAKRILRDALQYALERKQFGQAICDFQLVQAMLADSQAELYAAECMTIDAARRRDDGNVSTEASCAKMFATEMCGRVADRAVQILGGRAICPNTASSASTAMCACSGCTKARRRSSRSSLPATWCAKPAPTHERHHPADNKACGIRP